MVRSDRVDVDLARFPRPRGDNGRGLHWFPTRAQSQAVVDRFVPELVAMHLHWLVILQGLDDGNLAANDYLVDRLNAAGITPVMRIDAKVGLIDSDRLASVVMHYRTKGVRYLQLFNEPNAEEEWSAPPPHMPEQFVRYWISAADVIARNGGLPGLAPLSPSRNHADEPFLAQSLRTLLASGRYDLINMMWLGIHTYGALDEAGFLRYRRYDAIVLKTIGQHLPMIATEGGTGDASVSPETIVAAYEFMQRRELWFLAYCPWLIGNAVGGSRDPRWESAAWFQANGEMPIVSNVKALP